MKGLAGKIGKELDELIERGTDLQSILLTEPRHLFIWPYHEWYTRSLPVVRQLLPDRVLEFERLYHLDKRKRIDSSTYTVEDYLHGVYCSDNDRGSHFNTVLNKFVGQVSILRSAASRLDDILSNIEGIVQADLFDSGIDAAKDLKKNGHLRAGGAVAAVVLESHLAKLCQNHGITVRKKNPTISHFNGLLKKHDVVGVPTWRWIQRLADLRNLCVHSKDRDPTPDEIQELIDGVDKAIKTIA